jgi:hypothetical protein
MGPIQVITIRMGIFPYKTMRPIVHAADGRPSGSSLQAIEQVNGGQAVEQKVKGITSYRAEGESKEHNVRVCYGPIVLIINQAKIFAR